MLYIQLTLLQWENFDRLENLCRFLCRCRVDTLSLVSNLIGPTEASPLAGPPPPHQHKMTSTVSSSAFDEFKSKFRENNTSVERGGILCDKRQVEADDDLNDIFTSSASPSPPSSIHQNTTTVADIDTYYAYGEMLAKCGRLQESFEVYAHVCGLLNESVPLEKLTSLVHALVDNLKRFVSWIKSCDHSTSSGCDSNSDIHTDCIDQLLCPICEDILKYPVTSVCGHTFCRQCCFGRTQCSICCENFLNISLAVPSINNSSSSSLTFSENSLHSCSNHPLHKYSNNNFSDSSSTIAMASSSTSSSSSSSSTYSNSSIYLEQDVLVRRLVEKWWAPQLQAAELNDNAQRCLDNGFLDEALKNCNQSLMLGKFKYILKFYTPNLWCHSSHDCLLISQNSP